MHAIAQIAKHFRAVFFGGNWTCVNLKDELARITWQEATTKIHGLNTIAMLTYHIQYYVQAALQVLAGGPLDAHDKFSFTHAPINCREDWELLQGDIWSAVERMAVLLEQLPESRLWENFTDEKYGIYYRNLHGIIEHSHYHLGQITLIGKIVKSGAVQIDARE